MIFSPRVFRSIILIKFLIFYLFSPGPLFTIDSLSDCEAGNGYKLRGGVWREFPITFTFEDNVPTSIQSEMEWAFDVWGSLVLFNLFEKNETDPNLFIKYNKSPDFLAVAYANTNSDDSGYYSNGSVVFNSRNKLSTQEFSCRINLLEADLQSVALHEIGHILGLDHYSLYSVTMSDSGFSGSFMKTLAQGDIDGFYELYGQVNDWYIDVMAGNDV